MTAIAHRNHGPGRPRPLRRILACMSRCERPDARLLGLLLGTWLLAWPAPPHGQQLDEDGVKAGFILNFAKFTTWPQSPAERGELRVCGLGARPLGGKLALLQTLKAQDLPVRVQLAPRAEEWRDCHVLFVPDDEAGRIPTVLRSLGRSPVLTVSDSPDFVQQGGMVGLKRRGGRIRFDVNLAAARETGVNLSSHLLKLADEVKQ